MSLRPAGRAPGQDGLLTVLEVFGMRVPSDLVVLSACETARGRACRTEGIVGLTRAFMAAGAPRVLCSLWEVDDEATVSLMTHLYEAWKRAEGWGPLVVATFRRVDDQVPSLQLRYPPGCGCAVAHSPGPCGEPAASPRNGLVEEFNESGTRVPPLKALFLGLSPACRVCRADRPPVRKKSPNAFLPRARGTA